MQTDIYTYFDYRLYLRDYYKERKSQQPYFTYRFIAQRLHVDHSFLVKIFMSHKHLAVKSIDTLNEILKHSKKESEYFKLLVLYGRSKSRDEMKNYFEQILKYLEFSSAQVDKDKYEYFQNWYNIAVRELVGLGAFTGDYEKLARLTIPKIRSSEAKAAIALLLRLGLIEKDNAGKYSVVSRFITPGENFRALSLREFQASAGRLAVEALETIPKEERDISSITVTLSEQSLAAIKEQIRLTRQEIFKIAQDDLHADRVYNLNLQLFPFSKKVA